MTDIQESKEEIKIIKEVESNQSIDEKIDTLLLLTSKTHKEPAVPLTSITKRLIAGGIFVVAIIISIGWACKSIEAKDALIVISACITGGFALLRL